MKDSIFIYIYTLIVFQFFNYVGLSNYFTKGPLFLIIVFMFALCWKTIFENYNDILHKTMKLILFSTLFSIFSAWIFREQSIILGYRVTAPMLSFIFFFYLLNKRPDVNFVEKYILFWGLLYVVLWIYAFIQLPHRVFGVAESQLLENTARGIVRINFTGRMSLILAYFLCLVKIFTTRKIIYIVGSILFFVFIILQLTRQLILWTVLVSIIYLYKKSKKLFYAGGVFVIVFITATIGTIKFSSDSIIGSMIEITDNQFKDNMQEEDIRITEYKYFMGDFSKNIFTHVVGNGMPHFDSEWGKTYWIRDQDKGLYLSDVGYAHMYAVTGLIGLLLYVFLFCKSIRTIIPEDVYYAKLFILFMIPANIAASWFSTPDGQICISICIYILIMFNLNNNDNEIQYNYTRI